MNSLAQNGFALTQYVSDCHQASSRGHYPEDTIEVALSHLDVYMLLISIMVYKNCPFGMKPARARFRGLSKT